MYNIYNSKDYKRSRMAYIVQAAVEYFITLCMTDAFLASLLSHVGMSDSLIGVISSFISLAFLFQLLSIFLVKKITNIKKTVIVFNCVSQLLFLFIYIVPFIPWSVEIKTVVIILSILFAYLMNYTVISIYFKWANSFVEPENRAKYSATKETVSLVGGIVFTLVIGYIIDYFADIGNIEGGFLFIAASILILNICNFISLMLIKNESADDVGNNEERDVSLKKVIKNTLGNRSFISVIVMTVLWQAAQYTTLGFLGTFKTKDLVMSVGLVQIINIFGSIARIFVTKPFGKFSDKRTFAVGIKWAGIISAGAYFINIFATPKTWWLIIIYTVLYNVSLAGQSQNFYNITYSYVDKKYIVQAMAIKNSIAGVVGFVVSIYAGKLLGYIQENDNMFMGMHVYGQQLLSAISCAILIGMVIYVKFVIEKQKVHIQ